MRQVTRGRLSDMAFAQPWLTLPKSCCVRGDTSTPVKPFPGLLSTVHMVVRFAAVARILHVCGVMTKMQRGESRARNTCLFPVCERASLHIVFIMDSSTVKCEIDFLSLFLQPLCIWIIGAAF